MRQAERVVEGRAVVEFNESPAFANRGAAESTPCGKPPNAPRFAKAGDLKGQNQLGAQKWETWKVNPA